MTSSAPVKLQDRAKRNARKRDEKKALIAESALRALQELGYANTSLRDIAAKSDLSLGMLHYYFEDKTQLIIYCVSAYKSAFTHKIRAALDGVSGRTAVIDAFAGVLAASIVDDSATHRLWYDIRAQALFDPAFRGVVQDVEAMLIAVTRLAGTLAGKPSDQISELDYAVIDGAFRYLMQKQITETVQAQGELASELRAVLNKLL
jgi:AcrR family transcriptional regulator